MTNKTAVDGLVEALEKALSQLEEWEVKIDLEWGLGRKLDEIDAAGYLSDATVSAREALAAYRASQQEPTREYPSREELEAMFRASGYGFPNDTIWIGMIESVARRILDWRDAQVEMEEPVAHAVLEGRSIEDSGWGYIAAWPEACHEHINAAVNEDSIDGACEWRVVPLYLHPMPQREAQVPDDVAKDAERYRFLRTNSPCVILEDVMGGEAKRNPQFELDRAIDAAMLAAISEEETK